MQISKQDATEIVHELTELVGMKMNIIGSDGIIIASSDPERVGDFHEAAYQIVDQNLDELVVYNNNQYKGSYSGTNLPLIIDDEIIGVVGISGPHEKAQIYGKIIKRMTEILLQSRMEETKKERQRQAFERFLTTWVSSASTVLNDAFIRQGHSFGLDITQPYRIAVVSTLKEDNENIYHQVRKYIETTSQKDYVFLASHSVVLILEDRSDQRVGALAQSLLEVLDEPERQVYIGVDGGSASFMDIHQQYERAKIALGAGFRLRKKSIVFYQDLCLELVLDEVPLKSKIRYIKKIFGQTPLPEIERDMHTISVLYEEDGSIKQAAKRLIMHPNTLQYQLKRIEEKTGYDPRKLSHANVFSVASLFIAELGDQLQDESG